MDISAYGALYVIPCSKFLFLKGTQMHYFQRTGREQGTSGWTKRDSTTAKA